MTALPQPLAPDIRVEYLNPQIAKAYLERNISNRTLSKIAVARYARMMATSDWQLSDPIKFDIYDRLIDGQHRLAAVIESGATVPIFVVRGLDPSVQDVIDTGRARSVSDALQLHGYSNSLNLASSSAIAMAWLDGKIKTVGGDNNYDRPTIPEVLRFVDANPDLLTHVRWCSSNKNLIKLRPSVLTFSRWALSRVDEIDAHKFFEDLKEMRTAGTGDPKLALLRRLAINDKNVTNKAQVFMVFRTWNAVRQGKSLLRLQVTSSQTPIPTPI